MHATKSEPFWEMSCGASPVLEELADLLPVAEGIVEIRARADGTVCQTSLLAMEETARVLAQALRGALAALALAEHAVNVARASSEPMRRFMG